MDAKILNLLTVIKENCELPDIVKNEVNELLAGGYLDPLQEYANMWCKKLFHCSVYPAISRDSNETYSRYFENTKTTCLYIGIPEGFSEEEGKRKVLSALVRPLFEDTIDTKDVALSTSILCRVLWDSHEQQTRNEKAAYELFKMVKGLTAVEIDKELKNAMLEQINKILGW